MVLSVLPVIMGLTGMDLAVLYAIMGKYGAQLKVFVNAQLASSGMEQHVLLSAAKEWLISMEYVTVKLDFMILTVYVQENHHVLQAKLGMDFAAPKFHVLLEHFGMELFVQHHQI